MLMFAFLIVVFIFEYMAPHKFVWKPTYDKKDKEPFGCYVFDDVVSSSVENYSVVSKTFYQIIQEDSTISQHAFLLTEDHPTFSETDINNLYKLIHNGNQIMICTSNFPYTLKDTLFFDTEYGGYFPSFEVYIQRQSFNRDSIFFGTDTLNPEYIYEVYPHFHPVSIIPGKIINSNIVTGEETFEDTSEEEDFTKTTKWEFTQINCDSMEILVWDSENKPLVVRAFIGKGELFLVSTPLMFTNYGLLDGDNASYTFRLLSYMKEKPLVRIESYGSHNNKPETPLRYILSEPPLRWATYFTIILIISFMFFAAKRRQRVIPVINAPTNRSKEFMLLISNLYYQKRGNKQYNLEILKMRYDNLCCEIQNMAGIDFKKNTLTESDYEQLIIKMHLNFSSFSISQLFNDILKSFNQSEVSYKDLRFYSYLINTLLNDMRESMHDKIRRRLITIIREEEILKKIQQKNSRK